MEFLLVLLAVFVTGPWMGHDVRYSSMNDCYVVSRDARQTRPCKPEETMGWQDTPSKRRNP